MNSAQGEAIRYKKLCLLLRFPFHNQDELFFNRQVAEFVAEEIGVVIFGSNLVGVKIKIEAFVHEFLFGQGGFFPL
jgi:hypothetical protein